MTFSSSMIRPSRFARFNCRRSLPPTISQNRKIFAS
jgi:hypothetical protein